MEVIENQYISVKNVLSYLTRVASKSLGDFIFHIYRSIEVLDLKVEGKIMFSVIGTHSIPEDTAMDIEVLVPVDRAFESTGKYVYKPEFKLENALSIRHYGSYVDLMKTHKLLNDYLAEKKLKAITNTYFVIERNSDNDSIVNLYLGISGNIL